VYTIRRKYAAGGDVWLADCNNEQTAREEARTQSENFEHGAVYVMRRTGTKADVICCYCVGFPTSWSWWCVPNVLSFRGTFGAPPDSVASLPRRPQNF
jgi:hypothetical protein